MENKNTPSDDLRDGLLEDVFKKLNATKYLLNKNYSKIKIGKLYDINEPKKTSELLVYNAEKGTINIRKTNLLIPIIFPEYVNTKNKDNTARLAPTCVADDVTGIMYLTPQGISSNKDYFDSNGNKINNVVGLELIINGKVNNNVNQDKNNDNAKKLVPYKIIENYYELGAYNTKRIILFLTDDTSGYEVVYYPDQSLLSMGLDDLVKHSLSDYSNKDLKHIVLERLRMSSGYKNKAIVRSSLYSFSMEDDIFSKSLISNDIKGAIPIKAEIIDQTNRLEVRDYTLKINSFLNGTQIDFHELMDAQMASFSKIITEYILEVNPKILNGKVEYYKNGKLKSYERNEFMNMISALKEDDIKSIHDYIRETEKTRDKNEDLYL